MTSTVPAKNLEILSLEDWLDNPPQGKEWVDGQLVEKYPLIWIEGQQIEANGMPLKHSRIQARLASRWEQYKDSHRLGGEVYTEAPCRTHKQGRQPDVAYLTPALVAQFGEVKALPQSFPLCAEIVSPTDFAEEMIAKALEYLESGGEEVWLVFPDNRWGIVITQQIQRIFVSGQVVSTQKVLPGFTVGVDELIG